MMAPDRATHRTLCSAMNARISRLITNLVRRALTPSLPPGRRKRSSLAWGFVASEAKVWGSNPSLPNVGPRPAAAVAARRLRGDQGRRRTT